MKVIVFVGIPGSGKSTLAKQYENEGFKVINQDVLGNRETCLYEMEGLIARRKNVIIDRTNINRRQRQYFIELAKIYGAEIECVMLEADPEECLRRIHARKNHPTISEETDVEKKKSIIQRFINSYERPETSEGFSKVTFIAAR